MAEIFPYVWILSGAVAAMVMWKSTGDWVSSWICFLFGPAGLGVALVEYQRSRGL